MTGTRFGQHLARGIVIACVLALVVTGGVWWTLKDAGRKHVTAYFPTAIGLYEGNSVRVLGVEIGEVTRVEPQGDRVQVDMTYDRSVPIPADARAIVVAPALVSDRYVQFTPATGSGALLDDGATIPMNRTAVPLEIDELSKSLHRVSSSLGPNGANADGSLSDLLTTLSENMHGNGAELNKTITKLSQAAGTLSGNSGDLFATVDNLAEVATTFAESDQQVREFERQLTDVSSYLADERDNLAATVRELGTTLRSVHDFIDDNRGRIKSNVDKLASVTKVLVDQRAALAETLDIAPLALGNLVNTYNAASGTLDARANLNELTQPPIVMICGFLKQTPEALDALGDLCGELAPTLDGAVPLPSLAESVNAMNQGRIPDLPLPVVGQLYGSGGGQ